MYQSLDFQTKLILHIYYKIIYKFDTPGLHTTMGDEEQYSTETVNVGPTITPTFAYIYIYKYIYIYIYITVCL